MSDQDQNQQPNERPRLAAVRKIIDRMVYHAAMLHGLRDRFAAEGRRRRADERWRQLAEAHKRRLAEKARAKAAGAER